MAKNKTIVDYNAFVTETAQEVLNLVHKKVLDMNLKRGNSHALLMARIVNLVFVWHFNLELVGSNKEIQRLESEVEKRFQRKEPT